MGQISGVRADSITSIAGVYPDRIRKVGYTRAAALGLGIVTDGLALNLDASNPNSYPGYGTTVYDISGNGRDFTLVNGLTWNSPGYFSFDGVDDYMSGPGADTFGLGQEHTVEIIMENTVASTTTLFNWRSSQVDRTILGHVPYSNGTVYYDVAGCCSGANRVNYTPSPSITNRLVHYIFRCRTSTTPYREIIENTVSQVDSGGNSTDTLYFSSNVALIGAYNEANLGGSGGVWQGRLYAFRMYTSALTDAQILQNYNAQKLRFGY
jgi:hypothetical protein